MKDAQYDIQYKVEKGHWWYRVRRKMIKDILSKYAPSPSGDLKVLDIGCGTGELMKEIENLGTIYGVDFSGRAINFCKKRGINNLQLGSIADIPFPENTFDVVLALDVLERIKNDEEGISEIKQVLKKDGIAIIFVPTFMFLWGRSDELGEHYRRYTLPELTEKINKEGFKILKSSYFNTFLFIPILAVRFFVKLIGIKMEDEDSLQNNFVNSVLYSIFYVESQLLKYFKFPFGVSAMIICKKTNVQSCLEQPAAFIAPQAENKDSAIRDFFKQWPKFYYFVEIVFGPTLLLGLNAKDFLNKYKIKGEIINVGSGPRRLGPTIKNVDKFNYQGVDIVADIEEGIPFSDDAISGIICDNVLEHLPHPQKAVREFARILQKDGLAYISTPFFYPFHASPSDFTRWTKQGLIELFDGFEVVEVGVRSGPFSSLSVTLSYLFATIFSFGNNFLYWTLLDVSVLIFFPIKFLDVIFNYWPNAINMAAVLYIVVRKK